MAVALNFFDEAGKLTRQQRAAFKARSKYALEVIKKRTILEKIDVLFLVTNNYSSDIYSFHGQTISPHIVMLTFGISSVDVPPKLLGATSLTSANIFWTTGMLPSSSTVSAPSPRL